MFEYCLLAIFGGVCFWCGKTEAETKSIKEKRLLKDEIFKFQLEKGIKETMKEKGIDYI